MGNDGGSIPTRRELVKEAARTPTTTQLKQTQHEHQAYHWTTDPISLQPLRAPIVSDASGTLYNKQTILELLVEGTRKDEAEAVFKKSGIKVGSLKDVVEVKFTSGETGASTDGKQDGKENTQEETTWRCPITSNVLGPSCKAVYLVPCGHAFSAAAIVETTSSSKDGEKSRCLTCETEYAPNDVISIIPTSETEIARLALRVKTLQEKGLAHSLKKVKAGGGGEKKRKKTVEAGEETVSKASTPVNGEGKGTNGINNAATASLTAKVLEEQERAKKRKVENSNVQSLFSSRDQSKPIGKSSDFMSRGFTVPATGGKR